MLALFLAPRRVPVFHHLHEVARSVWQRWFLDRHAEFWLDELGLPSPSQMRARVVEVIEETADTRSFVLVPDRRWPGHRAGQFVPIEIEIDGVRVRRCYSISSGASEPHSRSITITVRHLPGGRMSSWLHAHVRPGDVVGLGEPAGDFVLEPEPRPLLLVAGGSGITPIMAILRDLEARDAMRDIVLVHAAHTDGDAIFCRELATMAGQHPGFRLIAHRSAERGRLDAATLQMLVPDLRQRASYVCGPPGLLDLVTSLATTVHHERFFAAPPPGHTAATPVTVQLAGRSLVLAGRASLLDELEQAGERPAHGCRMGICNTCRCHKRSGTVENFATGVVSSEPDQEIRLCVSIARSDLELAP